VEIRVLGALLEKEQTTPESYPLTINQAILACNQKSNRDPVTALTETEVVEALDRLAADVLAWRSTGSRAERWEHRLDRRWVLSSASKAIMTLLLLRGAQTPGELRTRGGRMHSFGDVGEVEAALAHMAEGTDPLVRELARRPGQREQRWIHLVGEEEDTVAEAPVVEPRATSAPVRGRTAPADDRVERLEAEVERLSEALRTLSQRVSEIEEMI
jgi:uncharacterized protein YceH (UPF0502 family)